MTRAHDAAWLTLIIAVGMIFGLSIGLPLAWEIDRRLQPEPEWIEMPPLPESDLQRAPAAGEAV